MSSDLKGKKLVLFGAGRNGKWILEQLNGIGVAPAYFVDNNLRIKFIENTDIQKGGVYFCVKLPEILLSEDKNNLRIVITPSPPYYDEIKAQIQRMGLEACLISLAQFFTTNSNLIFPLGKYEKIGYELFRAYQDCRNNYVALSSHHDISFLLGLISDFRFTNGRMIESVLEIGVNNDVSSLYMLKQGCKRERFDLYGIEIGKSDYHGQAVFNEATPDEQERYHLFLGSRSFDIEKIIPDKKIDMIFIDAGHSHPLPIIDLIHVIPFLHEESLVLLHDIEDHMYPNDWGASFIYCGWKGEKYRAVQLDGALNPIQNINIGCIKIPENKEELYSNIEQIVKIPFRAAPWNIVNGLGFDESDLLLLKQFMDKYYPQDFAENVYFQLEQNFREYNNNWLLYTHETKFFNYIYNHVTNLEGHVHNLERTVYELRSKLREL